MPYHGRDIRSEPRYKAHKAGRYVIDNSGLLKGIEGDQVDLHALFVLLSSLNRSHAYLYKGYGSKRPVRKGLALVDRSKEVKRGSMVAVRYNNELLIRRLTKKQNEWCLVADDPRVPDLLFDQYSVIEKIGWLFGH